MLPCSIKWLEINPLCAFCHFALLLQLMWSPIIVYMNCGSVLFFLKCKMFRLCSRSFLILDYLFESVWWFEPTLPFFYYFYCCELTPILINIDFQQSWTSGPKVKGGSHYFQAGAHLLWGGVICKRYYIGFNVERYFTLQCQWWKCHW